ncbi:MAG: methyltransferase domain-containing protein [Acidimicrobiales bacterium]
MTALAPPPVSATAALAARRRRLAGEARGRVLDLGGYEHQRGGYRPGEVHEVVAWDAGPPRLDLTEAWPLRLVAELDDAAALGPFDTVVSVLAVARAADPARLLDAAARALHPAGRLLLLEPSVRPGWRGALARRLAPRVARRSGLWVDRNVPALVRAAGLQIVSVERIDMPTLATPFRPFVEAVAVP